MSKASLQSADVNTSGSLKQALIRLYLTVKVRPDEGGEKETDREQEVQTLCETDPLVLVEYIRTSFDIAVNYQVEKALQLAENKHAPLDSAPSRDGGCREYEQLVQTLEAEVRQHIRVCAEMLRG
jgi:hypothetical protein